MTAFDIIVVALLGVGVALFLSFVDGEIRTLSGRRLAIDSFGAGALVAATIIYNRVERYNETRALLTFVALAIPVGLLWRYLLWKYVRRKHPG